MDISKLGYFTSRLCSGPNLDKTPRKTKSWSYCSPSLCNQLGVFQWEKHESPRDGRTCDKCSRLLFFILVQQSNPAVQLHMRHFCFESPSVKTWWNGLSFLFLLQIIWMQLRKCFVLAKPCECQLNCKLINFLCSRTNVIFLRTSLLFDCNKHSSQDPVITCVWGGETFPALNNLGKHS